MNLKKTIFKVPTNQDWIDLMRWLEGNTEYMWGNGDKPTEFNHWCRYKKNTSIKITENGYIYFHHFKGHQENNPIYTVLNARDFMNEHKSLIIQELNGIKVGDRVEYNEYKGYVAVIDPDDKDYMLRLEGFRGHNGIMPENWYPESEKKIEEKNCWWVRKGKFKVIEETPIISISYRKISKSELKEINKFNKPNKTIMGTIKNAFKSKEDKAMEHFGLGTAKDLNEEGKKEFTDFIYETGTSDKKEFLKKIVEAYLAI